jgi:hypothetical protein
MHVCTVFFGLVRTVQFFRVGWWPFRPFNLQQQGHHIGRPRIATGPRWYTSKHVQDGTGNTPNVSFSSMPARIQQREEQRGRTKGTRKQGNKETKTQENNNSTTTTIQNVRCVSRNKLSYTYMQQPTTHNNEWLPFLSYDFGCHEIGCTQHFHRVVLFATTTAAAAHTYTLTIH